MKKIHPFYVIGSLGFAVTGLLHIVISLATSNATLAAWVPLYLASLSFMCIGFLLTIRQAKLPESDHT